MLSRHGILAAGLLLLIGFVLGCDKDDPWYPTEEKTFGPPFHPILFMDDNGLIGTVDASDTSEVYYWRDSEGTQQYRASWSPSAAHDEVLLQPNADVSPLRLLESDSEISIVVDRVYLGGYCWSQAGTRVVCARAGGQGQEVVIHKFSFSQTATILSVVNPWRVDPSVQYDNSNSTKVFVSLFNTEDPSQSKLEAWTDNGEQVGSSFSAQALSPKIRFDQSSFDMLAYIDGSDGAQNATTVEVVSFHEDTGFEREASVDFSDIGVGAATLSWSKTGEIALFVNVFSGMPKLVVIESSEAGPRAVSLSHPIVLPGAELLHLAAPAWSPDGTQIALTAEAVDGSYGVLLVDVETGAETMLVDGLDSNYPFIPDWRRHD